MEAILSLHISTGSALRKKNWKLNLDRGSASWLQIHLPMILEVNISEMQVWTGWLPVRAVRVSQIPSILTPGVYDSLGISRFLLPQPIFHLHSHMVASPCLLLERYQSCWSRGLPTLPQFNLIFTLLD